MEKQELAHALPAHAQVEPSDDESIDTLIADEYLHTPEAWEVEALAHPAHA